MSSSSKTVLMVTHDLQPLIDYVHNGMLSDRGDCVKAYYLVNENGIIIIDNLSFHGFVGNSSTIKSRNLRQMVRKIEKFIDFLDNNQEYSVEYIDVGDRLGVCKKKNL